MDPKKRSRTPVNLKNSSKSRHINWALDFGSYVDKLNPQELAWLDQFAREYYRDAPRPELCTQVQLRERWRDSKANARDVMSRGDAMSRRLGLESGGVPAEGRERHDQAEEDVISRIDAARARKRARSVHTTSQEGE
jgi:hypothetical protein